MNPITFVPLYMERVWGGRELERQLGRALPPDATIGESWEIVDRETEQSVVSDGPLSGRTLHELWSEHRAQLFGARHVSAGARFPLLCKLLDARDRLSVQVHPPATVAALLGGEPKTEMWYFLACDPGSRIYAGLRAGTTRERFEKLLRHGRIEECLHTLPTEAGESIFIPSGRLHAIGEGNLIIEIQQNSDTTYRVFDWNRAGLDGKPRALHVEESLLSTDFEDHEPALRRAGTGTLAECAHFRVAMREFEGTVALAAPEDFAIVALTRGRARCGDKAFGPGDFFLLPAGGAAPVKAEGTPCTALIATLP